MLASSQWETVLLCNDVSHWLDASLESALPLCYTHFTAGKYFVNTFKEQQYQGQIMLKTKAISSIYSLVIMITLWQRIWQVLCTTSFRIMNSNHRVFTSSRFYAVTKWPIDRLGMVRMVPFGNYHGGNGNKKAQCINRTIWTNGTNIQSINNKLWS